MIRLIASAVLVLIAIAPATSLAIPIATRSASAQIFTSIALPLPAGVTLVSDEDIGMLSGGIASKVNQILFADVFVGSGAHVNITTAPPSLFLDVPVPSGIGLVNTAINIAWLHNASDQAATVDFTVRFLLNLSLAGVGEHGAGDRQVDLAMKKSTGVLEAGRYHFRGVAFWEQPKPPNEIALRCHGPRSIFEKAWEVWGLDHG